MTRSTGAGAAPTTRPGSYPTARYGTHRYVSSGHSDPWRTHHPRRPVYLPADPNRERFMKWVPAVVLAVVILVFAGGIS